MLTRLVIQNIGLIEKEELTFAGGLSVLTGETGAGKSMLIDALSLALGARADKSLVRHGAEKAMVEATFEVEMTPDLHALLDDIGAELDEGELVLRRMVDGEKSKAFLNGMRITQAQMKSLGDMVVDIHGQYDHQRLLSPRQHVYMLDHVGGLRPNAEDVRAAYHVWREKQRVLDAAQAQLAGRDEEEALLRAYVDELAALDVQPGEEEVLTQERRQLMAGEKLVGSLGRVMEALSGDEDVAGRFSYAEGVLAPLVDDVDADLKDVIERVSSISADVADVVRELERAASRVEPNPARLAEVDERLFALRDCARKHHVEIENLPITYENLSKKLEGLEALDGDMAQLEADVEAARAALAQACATLSTARQKAADVLKQDIEAALVHLEMPNTVFEVAMTPLNESEWRESGAEDVSFMVATNKGQPLKPLVQVASGGEVSRLMLALKQVFYKAMPATTLVFDEIDTGVGGSVADAMGQALRSLAARHQVFSITHLPQVAAKGHTHLKIMKRDVADATVTSIQTLAPTEREDEIARMLSGKQVSDAARQAARSLMEAV